MAYKAAAIANYFIRKSKKHHSLTPMKTQKLVYISHGWYLAIYHEPLIEELVEAWPYGPVIQSLYHDLKRYGADIVTEEIKEIRFIDGKYKLVPIPVPENEKVINVLKDVWNNYSKYSASDLSILTHQPDTPWYSVYHNRKTEKTAIISDEIIREHFVELYEKATETPKAIGTR